MNTINVYCDESNHLESDGISPMVLGAVFGQVEEIKTANTRIREIKVRHGIDPHTEIKWTKVSPNKIQFYLDLIDYFFDSDDLHFRAVIVNKAELDHEGFNQTHDDFYYKIYFELLKRILSPSDRYNVYLDIKDTRGGKKVKKLRDILSNNMYDFDGDIVQRIQQVHSHEVDVLQLSDILIGALQFLNRQDVRSEAKQKIVERIKQRSGYDLKRSTLLREEKMNLFYWRGQLNNS
ncbi:DUF3800 domain-containing protein [Candidatus Kaiserbacteria bacterium CG_4_8_14_3_um_filter_38_9]|uniref:DUF3800 domain-containing protein n=1 Tax=Candidatus Kaiserbacteria bacterium CG_4_8_14_3_um_filter_38_9 TaxID=1974599 RepID=A0A2M7IPM1_9BACT|nr:MAG: DUF3800 domain-containing protein [Candidatus Kaiserbacteria bacterium CG_4_8_14_3_um_filter_38_9]